MNNEAPFNLDELNNAWTDILAQLVVSRLAIQKQVNQLEHKLNMADAEVKKLKAELSQAKLDTIAGQAKQIIDDR